MGTVKTSSYARREKVRYDKGQMVLTAGGVAPNPHAYAVTVVDTLLLPEKKVTCPFCLGLEQFRLFLISTKKGLSRSMGKCPLCGQGVHLKTLLMMSKCTAEQYADWVFPYSKMGFWKKIKFDTWKKRLRLMGWTEPFWNHYKELKGSPDEHTESFSEYVMRAQREEAEAQGLVEHAHT